MKNILHFLPESVVEHAHTHGSINSGSTTWMDGWMDEMEIGIPTNLTMNSVVACKGRGGAACREIRCNTIQETE